MPSPVRFSVFDTVSPALLHFSEPSMSSATTRIWAGVSFDVVWPFRQCVSPSLRWYEVTFPASVERWETFGQVSAEESTFHDSSAWATAASRTSTNMGLPDSTRASDAHRAAASTRQG